MDKVVRRLLKSEAEKRDLDFVEKDGKFFLYSNETDELVFHTDCWIEVAEYFQVDDKLYFNKENIHDMVDQCGSDTAIDIAMEECSELIKSLTKYRRSGKLKDRLPFVYEEMADVQICIEMLKDVLDMNNSEVSFNDYLEIKMHRNMQRVTNDEFH